VLVEEGKRVGRPVLYYEWHAKCYLGAVHGISGIIYILLQVSFFFNRFVMKLNLSIRSLVLTYPMTYNFYFYFNFKTSR